MLFNSFEFIFLFIVTFCLYYLPNIRKFQVDILIAASLFFYGWHNPAMLLLLLLSAGINVIVSFYVLQEAFLRKKQLAILGVISNLLVLAFFKYFSLLSLTLFDPNNIPEFLLSIPLPIGISFFTFQGISLVIDTFRDKNIRDRTNFLQYGKKSFLFIIFFPQLVAGPIVKAHEFLPQISFKYFRDIDWQRCTKDIVLGYFLKMVVADNLKDFTFWIEFPYFQGKDTITLISMLIGFSCQIFADFAGYSLIAIGIARVFGYNLRDNFNFPYISASFKEFWKRWHISLSSFLMEYLYIPLGGNRKGKGRTYLNLFITMLLGGLWHGAAWSYAVWGAFHGILLAVERLFTNGDKTIKNIFVVTSKRILIFTAVTFGWLLFKLPEFSHVIQYFEALYINSTFSTDINLCTRIAVYSSPIFFFHAWHLLKQYSFANIISKHNYFLYGGMLFLILTNSGLPGKFIYFQF